MDHQRLRINWIFMGIVMLILVTAHLDVTLSSILSTGGYRHFSAKNDDFRSPNLFRKTNNYNAYIPSKWRAIPQEPQPAQIEIRLLKGHVLPEDENWSFSTEYIYSSKNYRGSDMNSVNQGVNGNVGEKKEEMKVTAGENEGARNIPPDGIIPQIGSRNIITGPSYCPKGQRKDGMGKCRTVIGYP